ncbi:HAMP domain-containing sensor histidine kinase [Pseudaeromonas sp. ZJS20]|uniref:sensor histidine kinase n=1 Tax=Pseudaeromonas aegiceratis TaxID=3153928 RepID=UPI00390C712C
MPLSVLNKPSNLLLRLFSLWLPLLLLVLLGGGVAYLQGRNYRLEAVTAQQSAHLNQSITQISAELSHLRHLMLILKGSAALRHGLPAEGPWQLARVDSLFRRFAGIVPGVSQLRWLDEQGKEQIRLNIGPRGLVRVPASELQNKADRYYFSQGMQVPAETVYLSPIDLNVEHGQIVDPIEPTLRATLRTGIGDGLAPGLLVMNINLAALFDRISAAVSDGMHLELLNAQGYWLVHPDPQLTWGLDRQAKHNTLAVRVPGLWQRMVRQHYASGQALGGEWLSYSFLQIEDQDAQPRYLYLLVTTDDGRLAQIRWALLPPILLVGLVCLLGGGVFLYRIGRADHQRWQLGRSLAREQASLRQAYADLARLHETSQLLQNELVETRKLSALGMMVAGVAHELNTPTGGALVTISTLHKQLQQLEDQLNSGLRRSDLERFLRQCDEGLGLAQHNLQRVAVLIKRFKRLAVDRSHEQVLNFELRQCVDDLLASLQPLLKHQPVQIHLDLPESLTLHSFPGVLSQVLQNLIDNGVQHGLQPAGGGNLWLEARLLGPMQLEIRLRDDGVGMSAEQLATLFDPFVTTGRHQGHIGLGMHLVHQWVTQVLQGSIKVNSAPGEGSCFVLTLPLTVREPVVAALD